MADKVRKTSKKVKKVRDMYPSKEPTSKKVRDMYPSKELTSSEKMANQITNYKARLAASGIGKEDKRNAVEKFLNLPEDQNVLFDVFDILDRPFNAIKGGIQSTIEGDDVLGAMAGGLGIGGDAVDYKKYYAGDILRDLGVSDDALFTNPITKEDVSVADIAGLGLDIFADPMNWLVWEKAVPSVAGKAVDAVGDTAKAIDAASDAAKAADAAGDATQIIKQSSWEKLFDLAGQGAKKAAGFADKGVTKALKAIDEKSISKLANPEDIQKFVGASDLYDALKQGFVRTFNYGKSLPNDLINRVRNANVAIEGERIVDAADLDNVMTKMNNFVAKTNPKNEEEAAAALDDVLKGVVALIEDKKPRSKDMTEIFDKVVKAGNNTKASFKGTKESVEEAQKLLEAIPQVKKSGLTISTQTTKEGVTKLVISGENKKYKKVAEMLLNNPKVSEKLKDIKINDVKNLTQEEIDLVDKYKALYGSDETFKALFDDAENLITRVAERGDGKNVSFAEIAKPGYFRKERTDDLYSRNISKFTKEPKYEDVTWQEANRIAANKVEGAKTRKAERESEEYLTKQLFSNKQAEKIAERDAFEKEYRKQYNKLTYKMKKLDKSMQEKTVKVQEANKVVDEVFETATSEKMKKVVNEVANTKTAQEYEQGLLNYQRNVSDIREKMSKEFSKINNPKVSMARKEKAIEKVNKLSNKIDNEAFKLQAQKETIENSLTNKNITSAKSLSKKASKGTRDIERLSSKIDADTTKIEQLRQARTDLTLNARQKRTQLNLQIENLDPSLPRNKEADEVILKKIKDLAQIESVGEADEVFPLFTGSYIGGMRDLIEGKASVSKELNGYYEVFLKSGLYDDNVLKVLPKGESVNKATLLNYKKLTQGEINYVKKFLNQYKNFLPEGSNELIETFENLIRDGGPVLLNKSAYDLVNLSSVVNNTDVSAIANVLNRYTNVFKKYSTFSPGFLVRSFTGNVTNQWLSGIPLTDLAKEYTYADNLLKGDGIQKLILKATDSAQTLSAAEKADFELVKQFLDAGFLGQGAAVKDLQEVLNKAQNTVNKGKIKEVIDNVFGYTMKGNEWIDAHGRLATLSYANKHPEYVAKLGATDAVDAVRSTLFDPANMSKFEQKWLKGLIPFYTFTKQNLMFQMSNVIKNTSRYSTLMKTIKASYDGLTEDQYRQYQKEALQIPMYTDEEGNTLTLKANLPIGDLGEFAENPIQKLVASSTPLAKTPIEIATGVDPFTGYETDKTPLEYLSGMFGLTNFYKSKDRFIDLATSGEDNTWSKNLSDIVGSTFAYNDAEKIANQNQYNELLAYQEYIKKLKAMGVEVPTLDELEKQGVDIDHIRELIRKANGSIRNINKYKSTSYYGN